MSKWSRETILREILKRETQGLPLTVARNKGINSALYQAAKRAFGSWRNALTAAGLGNRASASEQWTPSRIMNTIRSLARRKRPLSGSEIRGRYGHVVAAGRRQFGSWSKAVIAAGVDPATLRRAPPWTAERVIEAVLRRALTGEPLGSREVRPRSLADAGAKVFGNWGAALRSAGLDPQRYLRDGSVAPEVSAAPCAATDQSQSAPSCDRRDGG